MPMQVELVSPERILFSGEAEVVSCRTAGGDIAFLLTRKLAYGGDVPPSLVAFMERMIAATPIEVMTEFFDTFLEHDKPDKQYDEARLNAPHIVETVLKALRINSAGVEEVRA